MSTILVTGGAGYIGSHMLPALRRQGFRPLVYDNLSEGHRAAVGETELVIGDLADFGALRSVMRANRPRAVIHFAAVCSVEESVNFPHKYYDTNVVGTVNLLRAMLETGVPRIILSSTAAVYGEPSTRPISEDHETRPINPYGWSKLVGEQILRDYTRAYEIRHVAFRYFNAAGAAPDLGIGEDHRPETHLIPLALKAVMEDGDPLKVYGNDYPTEDGTCVRDYVHVKDLVEAHLRGLEYLLDDGESETFNLGTESGHSIRQVLERVQAITGSEVPHAFAPRRPGDPAALVASNRKAREILGWQPEHDIDSIISSAYDWFNRHPHGYADAHEDMLPDSRF